MCRLTDFISVIRLVVEVVTLWVGCYGEWYTECDAALALFESKYKVTLRSGTGSGKLYSSRRAAPSPAGWVGAGTNLPVYLGCIIVMTLGTHLLACLYGAIPVVWILMHVDYRRRWVSARGMPLTACALLSPSLITPFVLSLSLIHSLILHVYLLAYFRCMEV